MPSSPLRPLAQDIIVGSWKVVRAEPPSTDDLSTERFLHFTTDGLHYWEHPFATGQIPPLCRFRYHMMERGVFITPSESSKGWALPFEADGDCLVFTSGTGERRWWLRRIPRHERPDFLKHYVEPPPNPTPLPGSADTSINSAET